MTPEMLRDGIFALNTRRFGTVAELMIQRLVSLGRSRNLFHDLYDDIRNHRVEVKFSTVRRKNNKTITQNNVLEAITDELGSNRLVIFSEWQNYQFDCNIQQVKRAEFDILYYGLFFYDKVVIFKIESGAIGEQIYYSDKQHKGNIGEGQFHINEKTMRIHLENYLYAELSYTELLQLLGEDAI